MVWLFNRNAFNDDEYAPSTVTNIVLNNTYHMQTNEISQITVTIEILRQGPINTSPESIRPYPKSKLAQQMVRKRRKKMEELQY